MSTENNTATQPEWWTSLALQDRIGDHHSPNESQLREDILAVLYTYRPSGYEHATDGSPVSEQYIVETIAAAERAHDERMRVAAKAREEEGWRRLRAAYEAPDADEMVMEGDWVGFTRACAIAWCWNLFQYEPKGFVMPLCYVRAKALRELESGGIPTVFDYAARARELEARGQTPEGYRRTKEQEGAPTFSPQDVTVRPG